MLGLYAFVEGDSGESDGHGLHQVRRRYSTCNNALPLLGGSYRDAGSTAAPSILHGCSRSPSGVWAACSAEEFGRRVEGGANRGGCGGGAGRAAFGSCSLY